MGFRRGARYLLRLGVGAAALLSLQLACSGKPFEGGQACSGEGCGAEASGEAGADGASGGSSSGGAGSGGSSAESSGGRPTPLGGAGPLGGKGGLGGIAGLPGVSGGGPGERPTFPATSVLDDFERQGPELGNTWTGSEYSLVEQTLWCELCTVPALWSTDFGPQQEVHATLAAFDGDAPEINLVLKAQGNGGCDLIEVLYSPAEQTTRVAYCVVDDWTDLGVKPLTLQPGDRFGGRALADGNIEIYLNDELVTTVDASGFPFEGGHIGVNGVSGDSGLSWDDFGGGNWD